MLAPARYCDNSSPPFLKAGGGDYNLSNKPIIPLSIFFFALLIRLIYVWQISDNPFFSSPILDAEKYDQDAWAIAQGDWIGHDVFFQAPLYSYFLGLIYALFGHNYLLPRIVQAVLGALSALFVFRLGARVFDRRVGTLAGLIFALYGPLIFFCGELLIHTLDIFLVCLFLLALDSLMDRPTRWRLLSCGLIFGICALSRPTILIIFPIALLWICLRLKDRGHAAALFVLGSALAILPVTIRNYAVGQDFVLISSQSGVNFYMGNNAHGDGHTAWVPGTPKDWWAEGYPATIRIAENAAGRELKPSEISAHWWRRALNDISQKPAHWAGLLLTKTRLLLSGHEISNTEDIYFQTRWSGLLSLLLWDRIIAFPWGIVFPLALLGLALQPYWHRQWHLNLFQAAYALSIVLFFVIARYRLALAPILCLWSAVAVIELLRIIRRKQVKPYAITLVSAVLLIVLVNRNPLKGIEIPNLDGNINLGNKYLELKQYEKALGAFRQAESLSPQSSRPYNGAATALINLGRASQAKSDLEKALLYEPSLFPARNNLARLLQQEGDLEGAKRHYRQVLTLDSANVFAHQGFADVALAEGDDSTAIAHYQRAHELGVSDRQLISRWSLALLRQNRFAEALQVNAGLLALEPNNARAHHNQARIYIACDSLEQAARELETVLRLAPDTKEAQDQLDEIRRGR